MCPRYFSIRHILFFIGCFIFNTSLAQTPIDTAMSGTLDSVVVNAFRTKSIGQFLPVSTARISAAIIQQEVNGTLLPAFNSVAGVRMEQRSEGSYRLAIRGSSLRAPFGIRNVKLYWNDVPFSDPTGNTYLNILPFTLVNGIEILKGPVGAAYGLGTGGAVLLQSNFVTDTIKQNTASLNLRAGSFGYIGQDLRVTLQQKNFHQTFFIANEKTEGWRDQSASSKKNITWLATLTKNKHIIKGIALFTDLMYQTPGGLTLIQMKQNPRLARQATATLPGAVTQQTAVFNKTLFGSFHHNYQFTKNIDWQNFVVGSNTHFKNPFITNYETRHEKNASLGSHLIMRVHQPIGEIKIVVGGEWQVQDANINNYGNKRGVRDTLQFADQITAQQGFLFANASLRFKKKWFLELGMSNAFMRYDYYRSTVLTETAQSKSNNGLLAPRMGVSYQAAKNTNLYFQISKGFSPPTLAEIRPSDGLFYKNLVPEYGWNFEAGLKGGVFQNKLRYTLAVYHFGIKDAIVRQNNNAGIEYFVNAGSTRQAGAELQLDYVTRFSKSHELQTAFGYAFQPYRFLQYQQAGNIFNGNDLTGNAKHQVTSSVTYNYKKSVSVFVRLQSLSSIPLTDANDVYASPFTLMQSGVSVNHKRFRYFVSVDNLLNASYSLGNDINAAGRRFYNPSSPRTYMLGMNVQMASIRR
jgi:iron complex outermembrane receptor protein